MIDHYEDPLDSIFEAFDNDPELRALNEGSYKERAEKVVLSLEVLDIEKYIKVNNLQPISNPTFFGIGGMPTSDGLLSNEIFGITQKDRAGTFAYIDLFEYFVDPSCYKTLCRLDGRFKQIAAGMGKFKVDSKGDIVEDPNGSTGLKWLKANFGKIVFKKTTSRTRDVRIKYIEHNFKAGKMFINKYVVIPAYYRDVNTTGKHTGVGEINTLYVHLITSANALKENNDYGLSMADTTCFRIQDTLKTIYDWFCGNANTAIKDKGAGLGGKFGIIRANMSYTADYSSRLVFTAPELKVESVDDMMVTFDKSAIPLAAAAADFYPFMLFHMRKYFENIFLNETTFDLTDKDGNVQTLELDNPMQMFTDDLLKDQLKKFVYSHDNRFIPVELPVKNAKKKHYLRFVGEKADKYGNKIEIDKTEPITDRPLTWTDVLYIAAKHSTEGKQISLTRYPIDSYMNTIYTAVEISSTTETEPMIIDGEFFRFYPKIRMSDILNRIASKSKFVDTMRFSNLYLNRMGADYDGDTGMMKGSFFKETNEEIERFRASKANFVDMSCTCNRSSEKEAIQAMYNLTLVLRQDQPKLIDPVF